MGLLYVGNLLQVGTIREIFVSIFFEYLFPRLVGDNRSEAGTTVESFFSNPCHVLGDGDGGEAAAIIESRASNARHAFGDIDGGEATATIESI